MCNISLLRSTPYLALDVFKANFSNICYNFPFLFLMRKSWQIRK